MSELLTVGDHQFLQVLHPVEKTAVDLSNLPVLWETLRQIDAPDYLVCGMATLIVRVCSDSGSPVLSIDLDTDFGRVELPAGSPININHYVIDGRFIPIRDTDRLALVNFFSGHGLAIGQFLDKAQFFAVVHLAGKLDLQLEVPGDVAKLFLAELSNFPLPQVSADLYPYQRDGIQWLINSWELGLGAILADEMGLGKTLQAIALVSHVFTQNPSARVLILAPSTLVRNWEIEIEKFTRNLAPYAHVGRDRRLQKSEFNSKKMVISTYDILRVDFTLFESVSWDLVVCDEAQALKNDSTIRNVQVSELASRSKVLVTGTPVENSPEDLATLVNIALPGMLEFFKRDGLNNSQDLRVAKLIGQICAPAVLRREVRDVAQDLPPLVIQDEPLLPSDGFIDLYEELRAAAVGSGVLPTITKLQQVCCSPTLIGSGYDLIFDTKMSRLHEICREIFEYSVEKVIIFTTFVGSVDMIVNFLNLQFGGGQADSIDGRLAPAGRQDLVDIFNTMAEPRFLVINPKAGGAGLNLQGANHVIHFNPQWNPQLEKQATARAFRRGQERPVWVRNLFYAGTVEEVIRDRLELKISLADASLQDSVVTDDQEFQAKVMAMSPRIGEK